MLAVINNMNKIVIKYLYVIFTFFIYNGNSFKTSLFDIREIFSIKMKIK